MPARRVLKSCRASATGQLDADRNETRGADRSSPTDVNIRRGAPWPGVVTMKPSETAMFWNSGYLGG
jgi:hypothetical protein